MKLKFVICKKVIILKKTWILILNQNCNFDLQVKLNNGGDGDTDILHE